MSSEIKYSLYKDSTELEATRLRSILLFNGKVKNQKRQDMMTKAILSLILAANGSATKELIVRQLFEQFHVTYKPSDLDVHIKKLIGAGLLESVDEPFVVKEQDKGKDFFQKLERETEALFDDVIVKTESIFGTIQSKDRVKDTIRKALSVYFGMYGYSYFKVQKKEDVSVKNAAVGVVQKEISDKRLAESLIRALADILENTDDEQNATLEKWARAFVALETMSLDPLLNNLKRKNLKDKVFIVDTDVALYCLTEKARYSADYRQMIERIKSIGCKLFIAPEVVTELRKHIDAAIKQVTFYGQRLHEFPDDMLYQKIGNVFIDDYVHLNRNAQDKTPFKYYIEEFYDHEHPESLALLNEKLKKAFSPTVLDWDFNVETQNVEFNELENEVYQLTIQTPKGKKRTEEENWDVSHLDAVMYMAAVNNNETGDSLEILAGKTYIITDATRALKAASKLGWNKEDVVCHPSALMAIMMEMGDVKSEEKIINLFDNPFLVYVADNIWETVDPLLKEGATIRYKGFDRLKFDVDKSLDKVLTEDIPEAERRNVLTDYGVYYPDMVDQGKQREEEQQKEIEKLKMENEQLRKSLSKVKSSNPKTFKKTILRKNGKKNK